MKPQAELKIEMVPTKELVPYDRNAKLHDSVQIDQIAESIEEFNFADPIAAWHDENGYSVIIEGHGRLMAAKKLGIEQLPVIYLDYLSDEQRRAYTLVHNKLTMNSDFDFEILQNELDSIFDIDMTDFGFDIEVPKIDSSDFDIEEDEIPEDVPHIVQPGEVWQLGRHRLMCGDSTDSDSVAKLMDGNTADVCFTSPPYNVQAGYSGKDVSNPYCGKDGLYKSYSDAMSDEDYSKMLCDSLNNALNHCDDAMFNIGIVAGSKQGILEMLHKNSQRFCDIVVWKKQKAMVLGLPSQKACLNHICELIFCFNHTGNRLFSHAQWDIANGQNCIETCNAINNEYGHEHKATFPVEFAAEVIKNFSDSSVLDLFGGTGTTLIAAEQLNRTCYMMELDPHYCDIIIERWENLTGEKAVKVKNGRTQKR